jgi:hypothetical protein
MRRVPLVIAIVVLMAPAARAGLYDSGEIFAELPSQWRGFLIDQRALRNIAAPNNPLRRKYADRAAQLEADANAGKRSADSLADLGALYIRLGDLPRAIEVLRSAQRRYPPHFRIVSNLGTAWQLHGDLDRAAETLAEAVRLAPGRWQKAEEAQLRLVRFRQRQAKDNQELDDLFGVQFVADTGDYQPGRLAAAQRQRLPSEAVAIVQQLALWLPTDARLLWLLAELAAVGGDLRTAAAIMDGCVNEFGLHSPQLLQHRRLMRAAADALPATADSTKASHATHGLAFKPRSTRPFVVKFDSSSLPPISATSVNPLPWVVLAETSVDRALKPTFAPYLRDLDGKQVALTGFMQPLGESTEPTTFMLLEYPVGCWYCETPGVTGIVFVELAAGQSAQVTRGLIKVVGRLAVNSTDPESFLYSVGKAQVTEAD